MSITDRGNIPVHKIGYLWWRPQYLKNQASSELQQGVDKWIKPFNIFIDYTLPIYKHRYEVLDTDQLKIPY